VLNKKDHEIEVKESLLLSAGYIGVAAAFGAWVWWYLGATSGMQYFTGFLIEKSLALDNVFVIALIFSYFAIPRVYQHRVLFWGILGVILLRAIMIGVGATLVSEFGWVLYLFGAFLILTGIKMLWMIDNMPDIGSNPLLKLMRRHMRVTDQVHGNQFFVRLPASAEPGAKVVWWSTPLFFALVLVEVADVIFAVDSVPAILAVSNEPFLVFASNAFAIMGLRAMYFLLANAKEKFHYLSHALGIILIYVGIKMTISHWYHIDTLISLAVIVLLLAAAMWASLKFPKVFGGDEAADAHAGHHHG